MQLCGPDVRICMAQGYVAASEEPVFAVIVCNHSLLGQLIVFMGLVMRLFGVDFKI